MINNILSPEKDIVLIVDDTPANHEIVQTFLTDVGVKCENAFDGREAVAMCGSVDSNYYSLILMDINLPYMDGFETTRKIKNMGIEVPIIAVTAASKNEDNLSTAGADDIFDFLLFKPFNASAFYAAISPYIKSAKLRCLHTENTINENRYLHSPANPDPEVCDICAAIENMGNNPKLFMKHFNNFKTNNVDLSLRLADLIENKQYTDAAILCHSIKGLSGMLGLTSLYRHVITLEALLENDNAAAENPETISKALQILAIIGDDIRSICRLQMHFCEI